jgi:threonine dehydrogenase-like Zn-dependent dehydrogenase
MHGTMIYAPRDVRFEERPDPRIIEPTDCIVRVLATCVCGSDLWDYRGINPVNGPHPMGHEYVGTVEAVGEAVTTIKAGDFVVGSFFASDTDCTGDRDGRRCAESARRQSCVARSLSTRSFSTWSCAAK